MADKIVPPDMFLDFILTQPMTTAGQQTVSSLWVTWFRQWLDQQLCYGIEISVDPADPAEIRARFRVQGMPNSESIITVPVEDTPYEIHVVSSVRTGCGLKDEKADG